MKNSTQKTTFSNFEKTSFEAHHFGNGDKKHEDHIPLLFSEGASLWKKFGLKAKKDYSIEKFKVVSHNGQNYIFPSFSSFSKLRFPHVPWFDITQVM